MKSKMLSLKCASLLLPLSMLMVGTHALAQNTKPVAPAAMASMPMGGMQAGAGSTPDMKKSMMSGMDNMQKMPMSGDIDKDFAMMMKIHHQGAVDMAEMELAHGKSPAMKAMAKKIIAAQKKEIAEFDRWLATKK